MADTVSYIVKVGEFFVKIWHDSISSVHLVMDREKALEFGGTPEERRNARALACKLNGKSIRVETSTTRKETDELS